MHNSTRPRQLLRQTRLKLTQLQQLAAGLQVCRLINPMTVPPTLLTWNAARKAAPGKADDGDGATTGSAPGPRADLE